MVPKRVAGSALVGASLVVAALASATDGRRWPAFALVVAVLAGGALVAAVADRRRRIRGSRVD